MNTAKDTIKDLITDIRFSQRHIDKGLNVTEETTYRDICRKQLSSLFNHRHVEPYKLFDRNGWPKLNAFNTPYTSID